MIDSHVHLDSSDFDPDRTLVLDRSIAAGVTEWVVPATSVKSARALLAADWRRPNIHVAAGIHPHEVSSSSPEDLDDLEALLKSCPASRSQASRSQASLSTEIVAVGETGVDYHYGAEHRDRQIAFFDRHLALAIQHDLPVIVHARDGNGMKAYRDILDLFRSACHRGSHPKGVLHSFTGDHLTAAEAIDLGLYIGVGGILTFKKSDELRETIRGIPIDRILLETDAPYLAPIPFRGKRNEPAWLTESLKALATLLGKDAQALDLLITSNCRRLFSLT